MKNANGENHYSIPAFDEEPDEQEHHVTHDQLVGGNDGAEFHRRSLLHGDNMDEEDVVADAKRQQFFLINDFFRGVFADLDARIGELKTVQDCQRTVRMVAMALGYKRVAGADCPAELARQFGKPKETIGKPLNEIITKFRLPPLPGQRDKEAVQNMVNARLKNRKLK